MIAAIHQPNLAPRLKVLQKLAMADTWVVLDDVQFVRQDYQHRTFVVPDRPGQAPRWLTLPVTLASGQRTRIKDVTLACDDPLLIIRRCLEASFASPDHFSGFLCALEAAYNPEQPICSLAVASTMYLLRGIPFPPQIIYSSTLRSSNDPKSAGIIQLCKSIGAASYLADSGATSYLDTNLMEQNGIGLVWQLWKNVETGMTQEQTRNGSAVNIWARMEEAFGPLVDSCIWTRNIERMAS